MLRIIATLLAAGVSVARLKRSLRAFRRYHPEITPTSLPAKYLLTDGSAVFLRHESDALETLDDNGQMSFAFVLEIAAVRNQVLAMARESSGPRTERLEARRR